MSPGPVRDRLAMIAGMMPRLDPATWAFVSVEEPGQAFALMRQALATFREDEGLSLIVPLDAAQEAGLAADPYARITLMVHSALDGVGLTAAVSAALADAGIACNMVAACRHDHAFVPAEEAPRALALLQALQDRATQADDFGD